MSLFAALDAEGNTRFVGEVLRGAACGCFCGECRSPVVAKQGTDQVWHFAHEASQERPQCLPGSINLLRRLATEILLATESMAVPECRQVVSADWRHADIHEVAKWSLPAVCIAQRDLQASARQPVAQLNPVGVVAWTVGLWVQIGDPTEVSGGEFDGELVYHCPAPPKGAITTHADAVAFLQQHGGWRWQRMPDVCGALEQAEKRLQDRIAARETEQVEKLQRLRILAAQRNAFPGVHGAAFFSRQPSHHEAMLEVSQLQTPVPALPKWTDLKKKNSSFFAFAMTDPGQFWIAMDAFDFPGYYVVPGTGWWDGWDEALPPSIGEADLLKGAYCGDGPVDRAIESLRRLGVSASRIDSDASLICAFTGWKD